MLKVRLMGTPNDIKWFKKLILNHKRIKVLQMTDNYENKGTKKYYRSYVEVDRNEE